LQEALRVTGVRQARGSQGGVDPADTDGSVVRGKMGIQEDCSARGDQRVGQFGGELVKREDADRG